MAASRTYLARPDAFTPGECDRIIALGEAAGAVAAPVHGGGGYALDRSQRDVNTALVGREPMTAWLFDRLDALFARGAEAFGLPVGPVREDVQILRYDEGCHFVAWHTDSGLDRIDARRISLSIELSAPEDHDGGDLEIVPDRIGCARSLPRGSAQIFPSRALHRVTPVRRGCRWALVAWTGLAGD
ncbi:2OG-Fe(II) oxygenase [Sphingosinicella terrae]|uniref:2OG-Fe(II) oxygenase n=1 Tax=Sphingosinicella terrae TaxID=2172047 RepID=UPI000E0D7EB1|nr:2OG-Fe(II) oxygenase [Sphingosinicella terrae]